MVKEMRKSALVFLWLLLIGLMFSLFEVSLVKSGSTIIVPDDYLTIQEAINNANEGDTIFVSAGTYTENVVVNKSVIITSDQRTGIVNASDPLEAAIWIEADNVVINQIGTIGRIRLYASSNCVVEDNYVGMYGSIQVQLGSHNLIIDNSIEPCYGGIELSLTNNNTITRNVMNPHSWSMWLYNSSFNHIFQNSIGRHWSDINLILYWSHNNTIEGNVLWDGGFEVMPRIEFHGSNDNLIFHNSFEGFSCEVNLYDNCMGNVWDNGVEGNYWCTYAGNDTNGDGVGDTNLPHKGLDYYPLMRPHWLITDVNHDYQVNIFDIVATATAYGSTPSDPNWNPDCDLAEPYGVIDIFDIVAVAMDYGLNYPSF